MWNNKKKEPEEVEENSPDPKKVQLGDKIFGAHNNSSTSNDFKESFDADTGHKLLEDSYDEEEYLHRKKLFMKHFNLPDGILFLTRRKFQKI